MRETAVGARGEEAEARAMAGVVTGGEAADGDLAAGETGAKAGVRATVADGSVAEGVVGREGLGREEAATQGGEEAGRAEVAEAGAEVCAEMGTLAGVARTEKAAVVRVVGWVTKKLLRVHTSVAAKAMASPAAVGTEGKS